MKKVLSVRIENELYTNVNNHELSNSVLVSKALTQYFRSKEPNAKLFEFGDDYVNLLKQSIVDKDQQIGFLQKQVDNLTIMSMAKVPLLARLKMKLLSSGDKLD